MSRQRYEPVPQRDETIDLESIHGTPHYNYNTGIPSSIASSRYEPSITAPPSIPNSPPPSFHTHSSPGTPRPTPSTTTQASHPSAIPPYAELWGVASSTIGGETNAQSTIGTSNDALATIAGLKQRIEWLEESIGRLLMEKDQATAAGAGAAGSSSATAGRADERRERDNCCVTFTDASPDLERALTSGKGSNCCVAFRKSRSQDPRNKKPWLAFAFIFMVCLTIILVAEAGSKKPFPRGHQESYVQDE